MSTFCFEGCDSMSKYFSSIVSYLKDLFGWNVLEVDEDEVIYVRPLTPIPTTGILIEPKQKPELYTIPENKRLISTKDHVVVDIPDLCWDNNIKWIEIPEDKVKKD